MNKTDKSQPVFIFGCPRSGTTLLRLMLTSHSTVCIPSESDFCIKMFSKWGQLIITGQPQLRAFLNELYLNDKFKEWGIKRDELHDYLIKLLPLNYAKCVEQIYVCYMKSKDKNGIWGDKNPGYVYSVDVILKLFPQAKLIHVVRDGRAVFLSNMQANAAKGRHGLKAVFPCDAYGSAFNWIRALHAARKFISYENFKEIKYETLLEQPKVTLENLCSFLGIEFEDAMLKYHYRNKSQQLVPQHRSAWHKNTFKEIDSTRIDAWKKSLKSKDIYLFELLAGRYLRKNGYNCKFSFNHLFQFRPIFFRHLLRLFYLSAPLPEGFKQKIKVLRHWYFWRKEISIRSIREFFARYGGNKKRLPGNKELIVFMIGMPRTGTSLMKNFFGDHKGLEIQPFQKDGFFVSWEKTNNSNSILIDKSTHYIRNLNLIRSATGVNAAFCCIVRDPRDQLISLFEFDRHPELPRTKLFWNKWAKQYLGFIEFAKKHSNIKCFLIRYEDLVSYPVESKRTFLKWIGVFEGNENIESKYEIAVLNDRQDPKVAQQSSVNKSSIGRYKATKCPDQLAMVNAFQYNSKAKKLMNLFGYSDNGLADIKIIGIPNLFVFEPNLKPSEKNVT